MMALWLFALGIAFGSFLNVITLRYEPDKFILQKKSIGGRSHCPHCGNKLTSRELVPLLSFLFLKGRCRNCKKSISVQYPLVEFISGIIFVSVPYHLINIGVSGTTLYALSALWIFALWIFLLIAIIDIREFIIPDEANIALFVIGIGIALLYHNAELSFGNSFLGSYALLFNAGVESILWSRIIGILVGFFFFFAIVYLTGGRGMGFGDVKLGAALGVLFGWPDILFLIMISFILGAIVGIYVMFFKGKTLKSHLPFGPFLILGGAVIFFWGASLLGWYFSLFQVY